MRAVYVRQISWKGITNISACIRVTSSAILCNVVYNMCMIPLVDWDADWEGNGDAPEIWSGNWDINRYWRNENNSFFML